MEIKDAVEQAILIKKEVVEQTFTTDDHAAILANTAALIAINESLIRLANAIEEVAHGG